VVRRENAALSIYFICSSAPVFRLPGGGGSVGVGASERENERLQEEEEASHRRPSASGVTHREKHVSPAASVCRAEAKRRNEGRRLRV